MCIRDSWGTIACTMEQMNSICEFSKLDIHSKHTTRIGRNIRQHQFHELKFLRGYECIQLDVYKRQMYRRAGNE